MDNNTKGFVETLKSARTADLLALAEYGSLIAKKKRGYRQLQKSYWQTFEELDHQSVLACFLLRDRMVRTILGELQKDRENLPSGLLKNETWEVKFLANLRRSTMWIVTAVIAREQINPRIWAKLMAPALAIDYSLGITEDITYLALPCCLKIVQTRGPRKSSTCRHCAIRWKWELTDSGSTWTRLPLPMPKERAALSNTPAPDVKIADHTLRAALTRLSLSRWLGLAKRT